MTASVIAVHSAADHRFSKATVTEVQLIEGHGVAGDAHCGVTVKHRSRVARDPSQPNLRQVHLIAQELLQELSEAGLHVLPGELGENITTVGIDLLSLSAGTHLQAGDALVEITGLRNPCHQIESFRPGLLWQVLGTAADGSLVRKAGVMGVVLRSGSVKAGDALRILHAPQPPVALKPV